VILKRIVAILLIGMLLFNLGGYSLLTAYMEEHSSRQMEAQLDENKYQESDLVLIKVQATHLSSYTNTTSFVRVNGQVEISGIQYNFVKRRLNEGYIEMLCIPNQTTTRIKKGNGDFFKLVNDLQHPGQGKKTGGGTNFSADFYATRGISTLNPLFIQLSETSFHFLIADPRDIALSLERPPDRNA